MVSSYGGMEIAKAFSYGTLGNEVVFSLSILKKGQKLEAKDKNPLLKGADFLNRIALFEKNEEHFKKSEERLELLEDSCEFLNCYNKAGIDFPRNAKEYSNRLKEYINSLKGVANSGISSNRKILSDLEKIFNMMGEINLYRVHHRSC